MNLRDLLRDAIIDTYNYARIVRQESKSAKGCVAWTEEAHVAGDASEERTWARQGAMHRNRARAALVRFQAARRRVEQLRQIVEFDAAFAC